MYTYLTFNGSFWAFVLSYSSLNGLQFIIVDPYQRCVDISSWGWNSLSPAVWRIPFFVAVLSSTIVYNKYAFPYLKLSWINDVGMKRFSWAHNVKPQELHRETQMKKIYFCTCIFKCSPFMSRKHLYVRGAEHCGSSWVLVIFPNSTFTEGEKFTLIN